MELLTVQETAKLLKVTPTTVRRYIMAGHLPAVKVGRRVRVRREAIDDLLAPVVPRRVGGRIPLEKGGPMVTTEHFIPRHLTDAERRQVADAIELSRRFQAKLLAKYGEQPAEPGWELLDEAREQRTRELP